jgi:rare lipoprotein A
LDFEERDVRWALAGLLCCGCVRVVRPETLDEEGFASFYSQELAGHRTASGERYEPQALTAAHEALPFGSCAHVTSPETGRAVEVRITDRCSGAKGRIIDLSHAAAEALGMVRLGVVKVRLTPCAHQSLAR